MRGKKKCQSICLYPAKIFFNNESERPFGETKYEEFTASK